uniref:Uncharacterized protein n=1 Tax=Panagrolaimus sp. PS1159 TaxID=55785 RepID=A0AC35FZV4_9BILA
MFLFFILLVFYSIIFAKSDVPQRCDEISISANDYQNSLNTSVSLVIQVSEGSNGNNFITVKNLTRLFEQPLRYPSLLNGNKLLENSNVTVCISNQCFNNFVNSFTASVDNGVFDVSVQWNLFNEDFTYKLFNGIVDRQNLIFYDGSLFSNGKQCMNYNDIDYLPSLKTCCTSFKPIATAPSNSTKCSNFKAVSSVFEMQSNNLIATNSANFILTDNDLTAIWHYIEDTRFTHIFSINNAQCQRKDGFIEEFVGGPNLLIGRIILRSGQTLMEEGIPFSSSNQCQNITALVTLQTTNVTFKIVNQFCCTDFDVPVTPTASVSTTTPPPTKLISQQCDKISTVSINSYSDTVTTNMQIENVNETNLIFISDIDITTSDNISDISVCVTELVGKDVATYMCPNVTSPNSVNLTAPNEIVKITISYIIEDGGINSVDLFNGIFDQGNFISSDGTFFDNSENKCFKSSTDNLNTTFCCTSSNQNTQIPIYLPKCTNFKISSTFYNTTNDSIYTYATSEFSLSDSDFISNGYYIGDIPTLYSINNYIFQRGVNRTQFGGFPIQNLNSEFFIQIQYYSINEKYDSIFVGRIVLLEGQTFLEQGIPLTAANNCLNVTSPYHDINKQQGIDVYNLIAN